MTQKSQIDQSIADIDEMITKALASVKKGELVKMDHLLELTEHLCLEICNSANIFGSTFETRVSTLIKKLETLNKETEMKYRNVTDRLAKHNFNEDLSPHHRNI